MLHHFPHQAIDGCWHVVTRCPTTEALQSVGEFLDVDEARADAGRRNAHHGDQDGQFGRMLGCPSNVNAVSRLFHGPVANERHGGNAGAAPERTARLVGSGIGPAVVRPITSVSEVSQ